MSGQARPLSVQIVAGHVAGEAHAERPVDGPGDEGPERDESLLLCIAERARRVRRLGADERDVGVGRREHQAGKHMRAFPLGEDRIRARAARDP